MADFDEKYFAKAEKDLTLNDIKSKVRFYVENPDQPLSIRLEFEWWLEDRRVGFAIAFLDGVSGIAFFPHFVIEEDFQGKGIFTTLADHVMREWPKRGITQVQASYGSRASRSILQTGGFEDPSAPTELFAVDLKGNRAKEFRAWKRGSEEPEWRVEAKQEIAAIQRVNDSEE